MVTQPNFWVKFFKKFGKILKSFDNCDLGGGGGGRFSLCDWMSDWRRSPFITMNKPPRTYDEAMAKRKYTLTDLIHDIPLAKFWVFCCRDLKNVEYRGRPKPMYGGAWKLLCEKHPPTERPFGVCYGCQKSSVTRFIAVHVSMFSCTL